MATWVCSPDYVTALNLHISHLENMMQPLDTSQQYRDAPATHESHRWKNYHFHLVSNLCDRIIIAFRVENIMESKLLRAAALLLCLLSLKCVITDDSLAINRIIRKTLFCPEIFFWNYVWPPVQVLNFETNWIVPFEVHELYLNVYKTHLPRVSLEFMSKLVILLPSQNVNYIGVILYPSPFQLNNNPGCW